jgi:hypothetical protein
MSESVFDAEHIIPYIVYGIRSVFDISVDLFCFTCESIKDIVTSKQAKTIGVKLLWTISKTCVYLERGGSYLYDSNEYIQYGVDLAVSAKNAVYNYITNTKSEPTSQKWIQICRVDNNGKTYVETYDILPDEMTDTECAAKFTNAYLSVLNDSNDFQDTCLLLKSKNLYHVDICSRSEIVLQLDMPLKQCIFVPISVNYVHPDMAEPIDLSFICDEMYCVGNFLFSSAFVRRCLEYQSKPFVFDDRYTIQVIDSNVDMHTFTYSDYMKITENQFVICKRPVPVIDAKSDEETPLPDETTLINHNVEDETPIPEQEETPLSEQEETSIPEQEETPIPEQEETPLSEEEETPLSEEEETPIPEQEETPLSEQEETPLSEQEETPLSEQEEAPIPEQEETPLSEEERLVDNTEENNSQTA